MTEPRGEAAYDPEIGTNTFDPNEAAEALLEEADEERTHGAETPGVNEAPVAIEAPDTADDSKGDSNRKGGDQNRGEEKDVETETPEIVTLEDDNKDGKIVAEAGDVIEVEQENTSSPPPAQKDHSGGEADDNIVLRIKRAFGGNRGRPWSWLYKPTPTVRRRRQKAALARLARRYMRPKNASMVLNETHPEARRCVLRLPDETTFAAEVTVDGRTFSAQAGTRRQAAATAAEMALRSLVDLDTGPGDDTPWPQLASFALHKLLHDWSRGDVGVPTESPFKQWTSPSKKRRKEKTLPEDAALKNPVQLLYEMRRDTRFTYANEWRDAVPVHKAVAVIGEQNFEAKGTSRKFAKREAAKMALQQLCGLEFSDTQPAEVAAPTESQTDY